MEQPVLQTDLRLPTKQRPRAADVRLPDVRIVLRPFILGSDEGDFRLTAGQTLYRLRKIEHRHLARVPQIDGLDLVRAQESHDAVDQIADVTKATGAGAVVVYGERHPTQRLRNEVGDHPAIVGAHARTVRVE